MADAKTSAEVIVVGLGAAGSAVLCELARRGVRATGIDRYAPPHDRGSSHGETRITRQAIGEGDVYAPLALRSHEIWRGLEAETGEALLDPIGALVMAARGGPAFHGRDNFLGRTIACAERFGIAHEVLSAGEIARRFPQFVLEGDEIGYFEPGAGLLRPERCVAAQLSVARRHGATIRVNETVTALDQDGDGVRIVTDAGIHHADRVVLTAGAWLPGLLGATSPLRARIHRQVLHWFEPSDPALWHSERTPVFIWTHGRSVADSLYGFPLLPGHAGVKVATEQFEVETDPDGVERDVGTGEIEAMVRTHLSGRFNGLTDRCLRSAVCLYTVTPDQDFLVADHPARERMMIVSACSGHGFKHSAALGEAVAQTIVDGRSGLDLSAFGARRSGASTALPAG